MIVRLTSAPEHETYETASGTWTHEVASGVVEGTEAPVAVVFLPPAAGVRLPHQSGDRLLCIQSPADPTVAYPVLAFTGALLEPEGTGRSLDLFVAAPAKGATPLVRLGAYAAGELDSVMAYEKLSAEVEALRQAVLTLASQVDALVAPSGGGPVTPTGSVPGSPTSELVSADLSVTPAPYGGEKALQVQVRTLTGGGVSS